MKETSEQEGDFSSLLNIMMHKVCFSRTFLSVTAFHKNLTAEKIDRKRENIVCKKILKNFCASFFGNGY